MNNKMHGGNVLELSAREAREFFLKNSSYFTVPLPEYFDFSGVLKEMMEKAELDDGALERMSKVDGVNFDLPCNKDGEYGQRVFQMIHPAVYAELVRIMTEPENWEKIKTRVALYTREKNLSSISPVPRNEHVKNVTAPIILRWWRDMEQMSIGMGLYYNVVMKADIMECYGSVPISALAVALSGPAYRSDKSSVGAKIEKIFMAMMHGRGVGIPQGNALMDFLVEIFLMRVDVLFEKAAKLERVGIEYTVLRYRDDYRIFARDEKTARALARILAEVLGRFGMKLNPAKMLFDDDIIMAARKPDKIYWEGRRNALMMIKNEVGMVSIQKELFAIAELSRKFPNSGSVQKALVELYRDRISNLLHRPGDAYPLMALVADIMVRNPRTCMVGVAILTKIMSFNPGISRRSLAERILAKARVMPNTDYLEVCLQRLTIKNRPGKKCQNRLSALVYDSSAKIWNSDWLELKVNNSGIVDHKKIKKMDFVVPVEEVAVFSEYDFDEFEEF